MGDSIFYNVLITQSYQVPALLFWLVTGVLGMMQLSKLRKVAILLISAGMLGVVEFIAGLAGQIWMFSNMDNGAIEVHKIMPVIYGLTHILFLAAMICLLCAVFASRKQSVTQTAPLP
jgi:hypothetical protein